MPPSSPQKSPHAWRTQAKCADPSVYPEVEVNGEVIFPAGQVDTELFFPPRDAELYPPIADAAKSMCYGRDGLEPCPVRRECLMSALNRDEQHGIFGGKSHRERGALQRRYLASYARTMTLEEYVYSERCK